MYLPEKTLVYFEYDTSRYFPGQSVWTMHAEHPAWPAKLYAELPASSFPDFEHLGCESHYDLLQTEILKQAEKQGIPVETLIFSHQHVEYSGGPSRLTPHQAVDYMRIKGKEPGWKEELYAEFPADPNDEDANYHQLKAEILQQAKEQGIPAEAMIFWFD